jgi:DNA (cytosine-5)-methyltransferase 1
VTWTLYDEFAGCGGLTQGAATVPGVEPAVAANHDPVSVASHQANFPGVKHFCDDVRELDLAKFPRCDLFHASPICPPFCDARGQRQHFDADSQGVLFEDELGAVLDDNTRRGRLLMHEVPRYLEAMALRGRPVIGGTVENVIQARRWGSWHAWRRRIELLGYQTRLIAVNSMHLHPHRTARPPQSRDRLLLMYWLASLGRRPDLDKWMLRPPAWCPACQEHVAAIQVFKDPRRDMGRYGPHGQYWYRCPRRTCRHTILHPEVRPAADAIDWTLPAPTIGDRTDPLAPATLARIRAGIARHYPAMLVPAGGTWRTSPVPLTLPMPARTTRENDALVITPATGNGPAWDLLVPYYTHGHARPSSLPVGALSTRDRYALATGSHTGADLSEVRFRMLATTEIAAAMGFAPGYTVLGTIRQRTRQLGQAITPCLGEAAYSALIETISGQELDPARPAARTDLGAAA